MRAHDPQPPTRKVGLLAWSSQRRSFCRCSRSAASAPRSSWARSRPPPSSLRGVAAGGGRADPQARAGLGKDLFVRAGRGVVRHGGRAARSPSTRPRSLRAVEDAAESVDELSALRSGTVALGVFGGPSAWRFDELVVAFLRRHPNVSVRLIGSQLVGARRPHPARELEAGVLVLPIDDDKLDVRPIVRDEVDLRQRRPRAHAGAGDDRAPGGDAADLLRRRVGRGRPDPPPARRTRAGARAAAAAQGRGRAQGHRAAARRRRDRRHVPAERVHARAVLPGRPAHRARSGPRCTTRSRSSPARAPGSRRASASCSPRWRRTCARSPTSSTARVEYRSRHDRGREPVATGSDRDGAAARRRGCRPGRASGRGGVPAVGSAARP